MQRGATKPYKKAINIRATALEWFEIKTNHKRMCAEECCTIVMP